MKFLQLHTLYPDYLKQLYRKDPHLVLESYERQNSAVLKDGYGAVHMVTPVLNRMGYEASVIFGNCIYSQARWLTENQKTICDTRNWIRDIVRIQMETFRPDIVYATDSETFDSRFFNCVSWKPSLTIGWRGAPVASGTDWSSFDVMLSHLTICRERAKELGAHSTLQFFPGFPRFIADAVHNEQKQYDVVFTGQWTAAHQERNNLLLALALEAEKKRFSLGLFLSATQDKLPPLIEKFNQSPRWGMNMYRALRSARIVINAEADFAGGEAGNMRLFETTGVGSFLLTQHLSNIDRYFKPGCEIETFANAHEMIAKIAFYLDHEDERNRIAHKGQERCFNEYTLEKRVSELHGIIKALQAKPSKRMTPACDSEVASPLTGRRNVTLKSTIPSEVIVQCYRRQYHIDTNKYFNAVAEIKVFECRDTGYRFYYPFHISGDSLFYEQLEKMPWYYMDWKYEHDVASRFIEPGQIILEIGCAKGTFLEALRTRGITSVGLEFNEKAINTVQSKQLEIHRHTIQEHAARYSQRYDAVCAFQVLEHISDVKTFIEASLASLKPNGVLILSVPNHDAFMGLDDRNMLDMPPHHMGIWNEKSLKSITKLFDLSLVEIINESLQPYHLDYYASLVKKQFPTDAELQSALINFAHNHPEKIKGFTTVAVFKKNIGASSRSRAACDEPARFSSSHCITDAKMPIETRCLKSLTCHPPLFDQAVSCIKQSKIAEALVLLTEELKANPHDELANALFTFIQPPGDIRPAIRNVDQTENHIGPKSSIESFAQKAEHRNLRPAFLNLGCGTHYHPDWTNVDFKSAHPSVIACDLNTGIPFPDNTFNVVYHSHLLEHFPKRFAPDFLKDCHRVLKPGGILRVVVPDLEQIARWYLVLLEKAQQGDLEAQRRYEWIMLEMFDQMVRDHSGGEMLKYWRLNPMPAEDFVIARMGAEVLGMLHNLRRQSTDSVSSISQHRIDAEKIGQFRLSGEIHQWMYDRYSLGKLLSEAGFSKISVRRADESQIADFKDFHLDILPDGSVRKPDSLFMEAVKGSSE